MAPSPTLIIVSSNQIEVLSLLYQPGDANPTVAIIDYD